ncbi:hypothetical protein pb186bvf_003166 [Paramecium bursaria]
MNHLFGRKLMCLKHPLPVTSLNLGEKADENSRLYCPQCLVQQLNYKPRYQTYQLVDIEQRIMGYDGMTNQEQLLKIEGQIDNFEQQLQEMFKQLRDRLNEMKKIQNEFYKDFLEYSKIDDIIEKYELTVIEKITRDEFERFLDKVGTNVTKAKFLASQNVMKNRENVVLNFQQSLQAIEQEINYLQSLSTDTFNFITYQGIHVSLCEEINNFPELHCQISQGKQIQYTLLYKGSNDGLSAQQFWKLCFSQTYSLTIITTNREYKFGAYLHLNNKELVDEYFTDPSLKSFIFSYTKRIIYKLKDSQHVINFDDKGQLNIGQEDIILINDFTRCVSNIGNSFDIKDQHIAKKSSFIFGESLMVTTIKSCFSQGSIHNHQNKQKKIQTLKLKKSIQNGIMIILQLINQRILDHIEYY